MKNDWYDSPNPTKVVRGASWRIGVWVIAFLLFMALISISWWAFTVAASDTKGRGDAVKQKNTATNRIAKQERFEDMYADILASDQRIDVMAAALKRNPASQVNQTNLTGATTYCLQVVNQYNAEARKYTAQAFRAADLPAQIDQQDPTFDCKESNS